MHAKMPSPNQLYFINGFLKKIGHQINGIALAHTLVISHRSMFDQHVETQEEILSLFTLTHFNYYPT